MENLATIYRFITPLLDVKSEKKNLSLVYEKIEEFLKSEDILRDVQKREVGDYFKITLFLKNELGKIELYYISKLDLDVFFPIFKMKIYFDLKFRSDEKLKKNGVDFLTSIFECFDGLTEKEYLIDIDNNYYYRKGFFGSRVFPSYDFSDLDEIQEQFESKNGMKLLEDFITEFSDKHFVLTVDNSDEYYKLHALLLYFLYLVFLMNKNITKATETLDELGEIEEGIYSENLELTKKRLSYINDLNIETFENYKKKLDLFFKLFE